MDCVMGASSELTIFGQRPPRALRKQCVAMMRNLTKVSQRIRAYARVTACVAANHGNTAYGNMKSVDEANTAHEHVSGAIATEVVLAVVEGLKEAARASFRQAFDNVVEMYNHRGERVEAFGNETGGGGTPRPRRRSIWRGV